MAAAGNGNTGFPAKYCVVQTNALRLGKAQPGVMTAFNGLHVAGMAGGSLDHKTKELMALAISIVVRCDDCIAHHVHDAIEAGATREELEDAIGFAVLMGGGPGMIYATHAIEAVHQFLDRPG
ncbi:carboxymuconolactone decarboxylase family protein [Leisingera caerulea]|uniref:carboxymuconolactone decarboxylase family protein n=1 Tax=Leisingera caerulea TaxID=506591 RepID=UPI0021A33863|nr:carboxymuconolactone decarboxylase family protein [Leisingera caerulea]